MTMGSPETLNTDGYKASMGFMQALILLFLKKATTRIVGYIPGNKDWTRDRWC